MTPRRDQRGLLRLLGLPTFGLALGATVVSTYLPVLARSFGSSTTTIGLIIAAEGAFALLLPIFVGTWSDRLRTRWGGRLPFVAVGFPVTVAALALMGFGHGIGALAVLVAVFFAGYFVAYEPYRALYPDLIDDEDAAKGQGSQALWRGAGTVIALLGGGLLFSVAKPLPFVAGGAVVAVSVGVFIALVLHRGVVGPESQKRRPESEGALAVARSTAGLLRERRSLRFFLVANALWEMALAALKTFVVLYLTQGLGHSTAFASGVIGGAAVFIVLGAVLSGRWADRLGPPRVLTAALWLFGLGLLVPFALSAWPVIVAITAPAVAFGGGVLMTLPYAVLTPLMPRAQHGAITGFYSVSRGIGIMLGPISAGGAISIGEPLFTSTEGYAAMWGVSALAVLATIPLMRGLRAAL